MTGYRNSFGLIQVDDNGISKRNLLGLGSSFKIAWGDLKSFSVSQILVPLLDTGDPEPITVKLVLTGSADTYEVDRKATDDNLDGLAAYLRLRCPEKETKTA